MLTKVKGLIGHSLLGRDGEIGKVKEFYFDDRHWAIRYAVVDTGSWLEERKVLISPYDLLSVDQGNQQISVNLTRKQIEGSPSLDTDKPVSQQFEESYYDYYGWPMYWSGSYIWGNYPIIVRDREKQKATNLGGKAWNPSLRSTREVAGYHIKATDGEIGHVEDYLVDDETWLICYLVVDIRNWLPGKKVLISPKWIEGVSWDQSVVAINLSRETIELAPEYSEVTMPTREYEAKLHVYYNRVGYWI